MMYYQLVDYTVSIRYYASRKWDRIINDMYNYCNINLKIETVVVILLLTESQF